MDANANDRNRVPNDYFRLIALVLILAAALVWFGAELHSKNEHERYRLLLAGGARLTRIKFSGQQREFDVTDPKVLHDFEQAFAYGSTNGLHTVTGGIYYAVDVFLRSNGEIHTWLHVYPDHHGIELADQSRIGAGDPSYVELSFPSNVSEETTALLDFMVGPAKAVVK